MSPAVQCWELVQKRRARPRAQAAINRPVRDVSLLKKRNPALKYCATFIEFFSSARRRFAGRAADRRAQAVCGYGGQA